LSQSAGARQQRASLATMSIFSLTGLPLGALGIAMAIYVQPYFAQDLGVGLVAIAAAFGVVRLLDTFVDPFLAVVMDRTRTPIGRYRAWLIAGTPIMMIAVYALFMARPGIGTSYLILWLLVLNLGTSIIGIARFAWSANLVTRYDQRSMFYGMMAAISVIGTLIVLLTPVVSKSFGPGLPNDVQLMGWTILFLMPIGVAVNAWLVPEKIATDVPHTRPPLHDYIDLMKRPELIRLLVQSFATTLGPGWMANLYIFFFTAARGFTTGQGSILLIFYVLAGALGAPLIGLTAARFSKHRTLIAATICYSIGLCTVLAVPKADLLLSIPVMIWCGYWGNGFDLMNSAMMADVGDQVRLEHGKERMGLLYSIITVSTKVANAGAVMIAYPLLAAIGFVPSLGAHNSASALAGLQISFLAGPIFFVALGGACCIGWKLDATRHAQIRSELEARDALLAQAAAGGSPLADHAIVAQSPVAQST
jgi:Na+/melibiose symporter-like transporter